MFKVAQLHFLANHRCRITTPQTQVCFHFYLSDGFNDHCGLSTSPTLMKTIQSTVKDTWHIIKKSNHFFIFSLFFNMCHVLFSNAVCSELFS